MAVTGEDFISAYLRDGGDVPSNANLLLREHEQKVWSFVQDFLAEHGDLPTHTTVERATAAELPKAPEPASYYLDELRRRYVHDVIRESVESAKPFLTRKGQDYDPYQAHEEMLNSLLKASEVRYGAKLFDAREMGESVFKDIQRTLAGTSEGIRLGWDYLDSFSGGLQPGDVASFVGRPGEGKTQCTLYCSRHAWHEQKARVLYAPLEMDVSQMLSRLAGMETKIEARRIRTGAVSDGEQREIRALKYPSHEPFYLVDAQLTVTVQDLHVLCRQLRPDVLYIDGAYLLEHPDPKLGMYAKVAAVCRGIKRLAIECEIPVIASWQFNREGDKQIKKGGTPGLESIAHSDEIGQISRLVIGMFEGSTLKNQRSRRLHISKDREGAQGEFMIKWDWRRMDFSQVESREGQAEREDDDIEQQDVDTYGTDVDYLG